MSKLTIDLEKLRLVMDDVAAERGPFTLFGLFLREDAPNKWDLVVSAPWLEEGKLKVLGEFVEKLTKGLGEEGMLEFSRIVTLKKDDPALNAVLRGVSIEGGSVEVRDSNFFGFPIKAAYILRSMRPPE